MTGPDRIAAALCTDLKPVRPLPSTRALTARLLSLFAGVAVAGGAALGMRGPRQAWIVLVEVAALAGAAAMVGADAMAPGRPRRLHPATLATASCLVLASAFALIFRDLGAGRFVRLGLACLTVGIVCAIPAAIGAWLIVRRGFAVDRRAAGTAIGTFAGLAGLAALELHCPNIGLPHQAVWHVAVVAASALAGYFFGSKRSAAELMQ
jgi:hypothetical protein